MSTTKKLTRKEIDQDEFLEKVFDLGEWLEEHWRRVAIGAAAIVVLLLMLVAWNSWRARSLRAANEELARGLAAYDAVPSRSQDAIASFEKASELGGSRPIGDVARFYRARALMGLDRDAEAIPLLEALASGGSPLSPQAKASLAQALMARKEFERAAGILQELGAATGTTFPPDAALSMLGALRAQQGKPDEARKVYQDLITRFPDTGSASEARQRLTELGAAAQ